MALPSRRKLLEIEPPKISSVSTDIERTNYGVFGSLAGGTK